MDGILNLSRDPLSTPSGARWRWKLWLALLSPVVLIIIAFTYLKYVQARYVPVVAASADTFHARFERGEDDAIYQEADPAWQSAMTADAEHQFFNRVRRKLGPCTSYAGPQRLLARTTTNGTFVTTTYRGQCTNGALNETFTWRLTGSRATLFRYVPRGAIEFTE